MCLPRSPARGRPAAGRPRRAGRGQPGRPWSSAPARSAARWAPPLGGTRRDRRRRAAWARREGRELSAGRWASGRGRRLHRAVNRLAEAIAVTAAIPAVAEAVPDPALVEHLRHRAARDARAGGGDVTREDLANLVRDMVAEERRILTCAGGTRWWRPWSTRRWASALRGAAARPGGHRGHGVRPRPGGTPGRIAPAAARFHDDAHLLHVIDRILAPLVRAPHA